MLILLVALEMSSEALGPVDPRVQIELEKLNNATDDINKYEVEFEDAKCELKRLVEHSIEKIKQSGHKLGNAIEAAKPYYEARLYASQLMKETQKAAINYEKAKSIHAAAKEMVYLAEQGLGEKSTLDTACQEMLSHAASRVNQSQTDCIETRNLLKICELKQEVASTRVTKLHTQYKGAIKASRPYYETRAHYNGLLKEQKQRIKSLENKVTEAKLKYNESLKNLETISEEIHKMRNDKKEKHLSSNVNIYSTPKESSYFSNKQYCDDYLEFPSKLQLTEPNKCTELESTNPLRPLEREIIDYKLNYDNGILLASSREASTSALSNLTDDIEQWTEIRLSNSDSSSSSYSHPSDQTPSVTESTLSDDNHKITCTVFKMNDESPDSSNGGTKKKNDNITTWITRSSSLKNVSRRQSLDILIDASDRVKDVFTSGFQKVGRTLERRNSESEMINDSNEFFLFTRSDKDILSDEQIENLFLNEEDVLRNINNISK